eukprot:scaffold103809_cov50-Prasinocladus_malaysianus.AAC.1
MRWLQGKCRGTHLEAAQPLLGGEHLYRRLHVREHDKPAVGVELGGGHHDGDHHDPPLLVHAADIAPYYGDLPCHKVGQHDHLVVGTDTWHGAVGRL